MSSVIQSQPGSRSTFVSVVAWVFIVLSGFSTLIAVLQNIMIGTMFPPEAMQSMSNSDPHVPAFALFMFKNIRFIFLGFLLVSAATLISSIGLLMRKEWARVIFIALMVFGIIWNLGGLLVQQAMFSSMANLPSRHGPDTVADFNLMVNAMLVISALIALGFSGLFGWIIKRLVSPGIKAEFA